MRTSPYCIVGRVEYAYILVTQPSVTLYKPRRILVGTELR